MQSCMWLKPALLYKMSFYSIRSNLLTTICNTPDPIWKLIWRQKCPNKIKHFIWRLSHNSNPLRCNLVRRGMDIETTWPVCEEKDENGGHLFFKCDLAEEIWGLLNLEDERILLAATVHVREAVEMILKMKEDKKLLMIIAMWFIWYERNLIREEGRRRNAELIVRCIRSYAHENSEIQNDNTFKRNSADRRKEKWGAPPVGVLKLNCDASYMPSSSSGSWGFLIRDCDGDVVGAGRGKIDYLLDAFQGELIACLHGIQQAIDMEIGRLIVETDASLVVQAINSSDFDSSVVGVLIAEIKSLVSSCFIDFQCQFRGRVCNRAAHELAVWGLSCNQGEEQILGSIPENVQVIVANDMLAVE